MKKVGLQVVIAGVSLIIALGLVRSLIGHLGRGDVVGEREEALRMEQKRKRELEEQLKEATSASFIEKQAREKLGLAREGETIILLASPTGETTQHEQSTAAISNWQRWWRLFF